MNRSIFRSTKKYISAIAAIFVVTGCANTGIVPMDKGTYLLAKKSAQLGFGPPVGIKGEVYTEANEFCARQDKVVETIKLEETDSGFAKAAAISLSFRCVPK